MATCLGQAVRTFRWGFWTGNSWGLFGGNKKDPSKKEPYNIFSWWQVLGVDSPLGGIFIDFVQVISTNSLGWTLKWYCSWKRCHQFCMFFSWRHSWHHLSWLICINKSTPSITFSNLVRPIMFAYVCCEWITRTLPPLSFFCRACNMKMPASVKGDCLKDIERITWAVLSSPC